MGDADLLPENFPSVNAICADLRTRVPIGQGAARNDSRAGNLMGSV